MVYLVGAMKIYNSNHIIGCCTRSVFDFEFGFESHEWLVIATHFLRTQKHKGLGI